MVLIIHYSLICTLLFTAVAVIVSVAYIHTETLPTIAISMDYLDGMKSTELIKISKQELQLEVETFSSLTALLFAVTVTAAILAFVSLMRVIVFILGISGKVCHLLKLLIMKTSWAQETYLIKHRNCCTTQAKLGTFFFRRSTMRTMLSINAGSVDPGT
jgi:hypothetical protein